MRLLIPTVACVCLFATGTAWGQLDTSTTPQEKVGAGSLQERSPGAAIRQALQRHNSLNQERLSEAGTNQSANGNGTSASGGTGASSNALSSLLSLAGGSLGGISSSLGGLLGGTTTGTSTGTTTGTSTGTSTGATGGSQYTLDDLIRWRDTGVLTSSGNQSKPLTAQSTAAASDDIVAQFAKSALTAQSTTATTETKFRVRLTNSLLSSFFTAMTFGMQTSSFINTLKDALRPLIPKATTSDNTGGSGTGEGIEDLSSTRWITQRVLV
jgi:hypothetical protein